VSTHGAAAWTRERRRMSAMRPEPAQIQLNDGRPARFVWRGRLYTVLSIIRRPSEAVAGDEHEHDSLPEAVRWQCWRVTASPGKNVPAVAFRLCHDPAADRWLLSRDGG